MIDIEKRELTREKLREIRNSMMMYDSFQEFLDDNIFENLSKDELWVCWLTVKCARILGIK